VTITGRSRCILTLVVVNVFSEETQVRVHDGAVTRAQQNLRVAVGIPEVEHIRSEIVVAGDDRAHSLPAPDRWDELPCAEKYDARVS